VVYVCECGRLRQEHKFAERDQAHARPRGTDNGACAGYREARVEERPPASELRQRLAAVVWLAGEPPPIPAGVPASARVAWRDGWDAAVAAAVLAATGKTDHHNPTT
jgi:hypothetical protein